MLLKDLKSKSFDLCIDYKLYKTAQIYCTAYNYIFFHKKVFWQAFNFNGERNYNDIFEEEKYEKESQKNRIRDYHTNIPNGYSDYQNNQNSYGDYQNNQNGYGDQQTNERNNYDDYQKDYQDYKAGEHINILTTKVFK